ncbi:MAG: hypothetical protein DDT30_01754 [Dehalococcoidia bacterium]|nr:hypothetical protein [Bacillota bacterium]MBT9143586.1 hypothetical protein [Bacillota bacterium]
MTVLLVGADRLGNMPKELEDHGASKIIHWSGRKEKNKDIPRHVDMILVVHDYVSHALMDSVKGQAKRRRLPILFAKRGVSELKQALKTEQGVNR